MIRSIVFILLIIITITGFRNNVGPNNKYTLYLHGSPEETLELLLGRIDRGNNIRGVINFPAYNLLISVIISSLLCFSLKRFDFLYSSILITFFILLISHNYYEHHIEKFNHYFIDKNIKLIRRKLGLTSRSDGFLRNLTSRSDGSFSDLTSRSDGFLRNLKNVNIYQGKPIKSFAPDYYEYK